MYEGHRRRVSFAIVCAREWWVYHVRLIGSVARSAVPRKGVFVSCLNEMQTPFSFYTHSCMGVAWRMQIACNQRTRCLERLVVRVAKKGQLDRTSSMDRTTIIVQVMDHIISRHAKSPSLDGPSHLNFTAVYVMSAYASKRHSKLRI